MDNLKVWLAIRWLDDWDYSVLGPPWMLLGVYDSKEKAIARCETPYDFIGPTILNKDLSNEVQEWPDCEFPIAKSEELKINEK